jgi:hypothetical protein
MVEIVDAASTNPRLPSAPFPGNMILERHDRREALRRRFTT